MASNTEYVLNRLVQLPIVLFIVSVIVFLLIHIPPGDPARVVLGEYATQEAIEAFRQEHHLNEPLYTQYVLWLQDILSGSLGNSVTTGQPIGELIRARLPVTITLMITSLSLAVSISLIAGYVSAVNQYNWKDQVATVLAFIGLSIPNFFLAIILIRVLAVDLRLLPISANEQLFQDPVLTAKVFIMPSIALGTALAAQTTRLLRSEMLEIFSKEYVLVARAKGMPQKIVNRYIVFKNALTPVITIVALQTGTLLGGAVVIEEVFALPGIGRLLFEMVLRDDFPVIQILVLFFAVVFIATNLVADLLYGYIDPRIRRSGNE